MELLIAIINDPDKIEEVVEAFLEIGLPGATIIDSFGMGKVIAQDIPIFAGFRNLLAGSSSANKTIFSVIESKEMADAAIQCLHNICGNLKNPSTGIVFTIPVNRVEGFRKSWDD